MWHLLIPALTQIIDKVIPDPGEKARVQLELARMAQSGELAELESLKAVNLAQAQVNALEAQQGTFRGGWRPWVGWVCGMGMAYQFLARPILPWCLQVAGFNAPMLPGLDVEQLMTLLFGMLGLGTLRTVERVKGKA